MLLLDISHEMVCTMSGGTLTNYQRVSCEVWTDKIIDREKSIYLSIDTILDR